MDENSTFTFEESALIAIANSYLIADKIKFPFISKEILFAALYSMPDSPLYKYFLNHGATEESISKARVEIFLMMNGKTLEYYYVPFYINLNGYLDEAEKDEDSNLQEVIDEIVREELETEVHEVGEDPSESKLFEASNSPMGSEEDGNSIDIISLDIDIIRMFTKAKEIARRDYGKDTIGITDLISAFAEMFESYYDTVVDKILPDRKKEVMGDNYIEFSLPQELSGFLTVMNKKFSKRSRECYVLGRDEETKTLIKILMKQTKRNAILVGKPGVGKTALVEKLVWMIVTGNIHPLFKDMVVLSLDVNSIVAGTMYRGTAEERFKRLIDFLEGNPNVILFIDEIHLLLGAGACRDGDLDLANALKPLLARGDTRVIGATTVEEYENYFSRDGALKRRFEKIFVKEPRTSEVLSMIGNQVKRLEETHHVHISDELIQEVINKASCFNFETCNPDRSLDLLDKVMVSAELEGRDEVTMDDVLENFNIYFKKFEKMSPKLKRSTAYHEAGHYIVTKFSEELVEYELLAVSIYPAEGYLGVNVFDIDTEATSSGSLEYHIQRIASLLAGRIAEEYYSKTFTSGAASDLVKASDIANRVVTQYALDGKASKYRVYNSSKERMPTYSQKTVNSVDERIDAILDMAEEYAKKLLEEKKVYLEVLVDALVEKGMLTEPEISKLFATIKKSRSAKRVTVTY